MANSSTSTKSPGTGESTSPESNKTFFANAQETLGGAFDATMGAAKQHPVAAAAIAAGTAAAVGGAVYAATQMRGTGGGNSSSSSSSKK